ncbi:MAG: biotin--[acetyl-CoA-carboxylase] ligase [Bacteroidota bacterium]
MNIIKLDATKSTNDYLKKLNAEKSLSNFTVVVAKSQTNGRGQMGSTWESEDYKNLTFSVFVKELKLNIKHKFYLSIVAALAVLKAIEKLSIKQLHVKWPNDILAENQKIGGILIENVVAKQIDSSIIGIGLNVNQTNFKDLPKANSLKKITGVHFDLDFLLSSILNQLNFFLQRLNSRNFKSLKAEYELSLFRKDKPSTFEDNSNIRFTGYIQGISEDGKLLLLLEDNVIESFDFKQLKLLY